MVVGALAKPERSEGASYRKTFKGLFTHIPLNLTHAKIIAKRVFLGIAKTSQLPENKVGLQFLSSDLHSHKVGSKH